MPHKVALIFGVSGQDGALLAKLLLDKGYIVHGTSRGSTKSLFPSLDILNIRKDINLHSLSLRDSDKLLRVVKRVRPCEIYNLSGQSSVAVSFVQPEMTMDSILDVTANILEAIRIVGKDIRFYNAASSECFGDTGRIPAAESTWFRPKSPYGIAKSEAFHKVVNYRETYSLHACSGILFNHESLLRPERFVTRKVSMAAARIAMGSDEQLVMGDLSIERDWGWAPEYVLAMWSMLQREVPEDFVIATGRSNSLKSFVKNAFSAVGLDWENHVVQDQSLFRPSEIRYGCGDPSKARELLDWSAKLSLEDIAVRMVEYEMRRINGVPFEDLLF
jgi:GDPmannose 4,6-dehydratase